MDIRFSNSTVPRLSSIYRGECQAPRWLSWILISVIGGFSAVAFAGNADLGITAQFVGIGASRHQLVVYLRSSADELWAHHVGLYRRYSDDLVRARGSHHQRGLRLRLYAAPASPATSVTCTDGTGIAVSAETSPAGTVELHGIDRREYG